MCHISLINYTLKSILNKLNLTAFAIKNLFYPWGILPNDFYPIISFIFAKIYQNSKDLPEKYLQTWENLQYITFKFHKRSYNSNPLLFLAILLFQIFFIFSQHCLNRLQVLLFIKSDIILTNWRWTICQFKLINKILSKIYTLECSTGHSYLWKLCLELISQLHLYLSSLTDGTI